MAGLLGDMPNVRAMKQLNSGFDPYSQREQTPWADWGNSVADFFKWSPEAIAEIGARDDTVQALLDQGDFGGAARVPRGPELYRNFVPELLGVGTIKRVGDAVGTYASRLNPAIEAMKQEKMTAAQAQGHFKNFPGGVGSDELEYTGVQGLLDQGGPVTRTGLLEQANMQPLEITDVVKGIDEGQVARLTAEENKWADIAEDIQDEMLVFEESDLPIPEGMRDRWLEASQKSQQAGEDLIDVHMIADNEDYAPKFSEYQLPGGEDYREMLMTLPNNSAAKLDARRIEIEGLGTRATSEQKQEWADIMNKLKPDDRDIEGISRFRGMPDYTGGHYDEPNVLAHARYNTRNIDGDKTLFVEEIQSDWHQTGRDKGYQQDQTASAAAIRAKKSEIEGINAERDAAKPYYDVNKINTIDDLPPHTAQESSLYDRYLKANEELSVLKDEGMRLGAGVPDAPYKKNWQDLTLKRMLKEAADGGHDRIAWTPGEVQIDRYEESLRRNVDEVTYEPTGDGTYNVAASKGGSSVHDVDGVTLDEIEELYGKDIASKIESDAGMGVPESPLRPDIRALRGDGLSIGGDGMKGFYDKILVNSANKFGKKYGAKVEVKQIGGNEVWSMKITPEMKKALAGGVALSGMGLLNANQVGAGLLSDDN